jgi:hypothetical protein
MTRTFLVVAALVLLGAIDAQAQSQVDSWTLSFYMPGASQPFQGPMPILNTDVTCSRPKQTTGSNTNPTRTVWDDPANSTLDCVAATTQGVPIPFPTQVGNYEGALRAVNLAGTSAESNRAPFVVAVAPAAPTNLRLVR